MALVADPGGTTVRGMDNGILSGGRHEDTEQA